MRDVKKMEKDTATLGLTNFTSMTIKIWDNGEGVDYWFNGTKDNQTYEAEIEYIADKDDVLGCEDDNEVYSAFKAIDGNCYFIEEFLRDNYC